MAKITLIGSGNVATALGRAFTAAGHEIIQVWSRSEDTAKPLAAMLQCDYTVSLAAISPGADIYIIAVKDDAIEAIAKQLSLIDKVVGHTSGIKSKELIKGASDYYGVFYPFVSMTKEVPTDFAKALLMIEGSNERATNELMELAQSISGNVRSVEEGQRQHLHLAAVFANNFTNHLYTIAEQIVKEKGLPFDELRPLIAAHLSNIAKISPAQLQTGPAIRHDSSTINEHLALLEGKADIQELYLTMTEAIQQWHRPKE